MALHAAQSPDRWPSAAQGHATAAAPCAHCGHPASSHHVYYYYYNNNHPYDGQPTGRSARAAGAGPIDRMTGAQPTPHEDADEDAAAAAHRNIMLTVGPPLWEGLHRLAFMLPPDVPLSRRMREAIMGHLEGMTMLLPCAACRRHFYRLLRIDRPPALRDGDAFARWTVDAHNDVNMRLGKSLFTHEQARAKYAADVGASCPDPRLDDRDHGYPRAAGEQGGSAGGNSDPSRQVVSFPSPAHATSAHGSASSRALAAYRCVPAAYEDTGGMYAAAGLTRGDDATRAGESAPQHGRQRVWPTVVCGALLVLVIVALVVALALGSFRGAFGASRRRCGRDGVECGATRLVAPGALTYNTVVGGGGAGGDGTALLKPGVVGHAPERPYLALDPVLSSALMATAPSSLR